MNKLRGRIFYSILMVASLGAGIATAEPSKPSATRVNPSVSQGPTQLGPKLAFDHIAHSPSPTKPGVHLIVSASVVNKGFSASGPNFTFQMTCSVVSGGACPIASNPAPISIPSLPAGGNKTFTFVSASAAQTGTFKLTFKIFNAAAQTVATSEINVSVN